MEPENESNELKREGWEALGQAEMQEILTRRRAAGHTPPDADRKAAAECRKSLVGLALSGGGIRSASFNLGLLQAFYERRLLSYVDYLASVSGGGFVAGFLASKVLRSGRKGASAEPDGGPPTCSAGPRPTVEAAEALVSTPTGRQPDQILRLIHSGRYLVRPLRFFNRYLIGVFLLNMLVFSGVIALTVGAALLFRSLDVPPIMDWLNAAGFQSDLARALAPSAVLFIAWLVAWIISFWRDRSRAVGQVAQVLAALLVVSVLLALAMLAGTGDIDLHAIAARFGAAENAEAWNQNVTQMAKRAGWVFSILVSMGLIPFLVPKRLMGSGLRPARTFERVVFWFATRAFVIGLPLVLFALLARENISGYNEQRPGLSWFDVGRARETRFWDLVQAERRSGEEPGYTIWETLRNSPGYLAFRKERAADGQNGAAGFQEEGDPQMADDALLMRYVLSPGILGEQADLINGQMGLGMRVWYLLDCWRGGRDNQVRHIVELLAGARQRRTEIFDRINDELIHKMPEDEKLWSKLVKSTAATPETAVETSVLKEDKTKTASSAEKERVSELQRKHRILAALWHDDQQRTGRAKDSSAPQDASSWVPPAKLQEQIGITHRQLLQNHYAGKEVMLRVTPSFASVVAIEDQSTRLWILGGALAIFLPALLLIRHNETSMHGFYREQLAQAWMDGASGGPREIPLAQLHTTEKGFPYHLFCATVHRADARQNLKVGPEEQFLFSRAYCGSESMGYESTSRYLSGTYDLANAVAISGAAVSPTRVGNPFVSLLLLLLNFRLGQWLPVPGRRSASSAVRPWDLVVDLVGSRCFGYHPKYCFVTDGGHYDNLGLEPLLLRRCRLIIVSDASHDPDSLFLDFLRVERRMRIQHGIRFQSLEFDGDLPLGSVQRTDPDPNSLNRSHLVVGRICYPARDGLPPCEGYLIYAKPSFTGDEGHELLQYRRSADAFPHDSTSDQFFAPDRFDAYRQLGFHIGQAISAALAADVPAAVARQVGGAWRKDELGRYLSPWTASGAPDAGPDAAGPRLRSRWPAGADQAAADLPEPDTAEHVQALVVHLASPHPEIHATAEKSLLHVDASDPVLMAALLAGLDSGESSVRLRVLRLLRQLPHTSHAQSRVTRLLDDADTDQELRELAREYLEQSNGRSNGRKSRLPSRPLRR